MKKKVAQAIWGGGGGGGGGKRLEILPLEVPRGITDPQKITLSTTLSIHSK